MLDKVIIKNITGKQASNLCADIIKDLPEWFGMEDCNKLYEQGVGERLCFYAELPDGNKVGMISIDVPYDNNVTIYWLGIKPKYHRLGIGTKLIQAIETYCFCTKIGSITVETISPKQQDQNYLKTYKFYEQQNFKPLFDKRIDPENILVFMQKYIALPKMRLIDLTHIFSPEIPSWNGGCGVTTEVKLDYQDCKTDVKFRVQQIKMHAGIGTHLDAPAHCVLDGTTIENIGLDKLILPCIKIDVSDKDDATYSLTVADIQAFEDKYGNCFSGAFVVVYTGWDKHWHDPEKYRNNYIFPSISKIAAELFIERNVAGVGIDTFSPDKPKDGFSVHQLFLGNNKLIIENIANASFLPAIGSHVIALPLKIKGATEAPVRLIAFSM